MEGEIWVLLRGFGLLSELGVSICTMIRWTCDETVEKRRASEQASHRERTRTIGVSTNEN